MCLQMCDGPKLYSMRLFLQKKENNIYHDLSMFIRFINHIMVSHSQMAMLGPKLARCFHQRIPPAPLCVALAARSRRVSPVSAALPRTSEGICQVMCAMVKLHGIYGFYEEQWGYAGI